MMAAEALLRSFVFVLLSFYSTDIVESAIFPSIDDFGIDYYTTEVQFTDVTQQISVYATEYYDNFDDRGSLKLNFQGSQRQIFYDNDTFQIIDVNGPNCTVSDEDLSDFDYYDIYIGWLHKDPLVIGPSAALWIAQSRKDEVVSSGTVNVRNIDCEKFELPLKTKKDDLKIEIYLAPEGWGTPYKHEKLRVPIRVRVRGESSRYSADEETKVTVDQITDFAYFRPTVENFNNFLPPIGLGCKDKKATKDFPAIPESFMYSAEVVDLLQIPKHDDVEIQFQKVWYDHTTYLARLDTYTKKDGYRSALYDFNTGTMYKRQADGTCRTAMLRNAEFEIIDYGMTSRMMEPKEVLNVDGTFYEMGEREMRGLICDTYESVQYDVEFRGKTYYKLVTTVYFTKSITKVGNKGEPISRIPMYLLINGWKTADEKTLQLQYNIFEFDDVIWPEMYSTFKLERCYTKADSKAYFVLILDVPIKAAARMEEQDELIIRELRTLISRHAKVPDMRIPFLKADYKPTGVYVTGVMLERPPAILQFFQFDEGPTVTYDKFLKPSVESRNVEECAFSCVDETDFLCKGFFFCREACFLKSIDPLDIVHDGKETDLGVCTEYLRAEIDSSNFRQAYLDEALANLEIDILNDTFSVEFTIPNGEEIVLVSDIVIGDGPYTGEDAGDKPFVVSVELRKLDPSLQSTKIPEYADTLHDCYKRCKEAGSECSSFSFCPDAANDKKECMYTADIVVKGLTKDTDLLPDKNCNIYNLKFLDYFTAYPERVSLLPGEKVISSTDSLEQCAKVCRLEEEFKCRGFEYCRSKKICTLHTKHILDLKPGESGTGSGKGCIHYAARYAADYINMGGVLVDDNSNVRSEITLDECAKICSEELGDECKSFNYCPNEDPAQTTCAMSSKLLRDDDVTTTENWKCAHYEKRDSVTDWSKGNVQKLSTGAGYTKKGFTGLVLGLMAFGLIMGGLAFVLFSYCKTKNSSGEGMSIRFMRNES